LNGFIPFFSISKKRSSFGCLGNGDDGGDLLRTHFIRTNINIICNKYFLNIVDTTKNFSYNKMKFIVSFFQVFNIYIYFFFKFKGNI